MTQACTFLQSAEQDVEEIVDYISHDSAQAGATFRVALQHVCELLVELPEAGSTRTFRNPGIIKRILFAKPKKNMRKIVTAFQKFLYDTRQRIELDFRNLKMFFGLVTSLPRSVTGYFANYIYSILAYVLCA